MPGIALREDYDAAGLRKHARRASDPRQVRRLLALAELVEIGPDRAFHCVVRWRRID
jgi:hypothetical protein